MKVAVSLFLAVLVGAVAPYLGVAAAAAAAVVDHNSFPHILTVKTTRETVFEWSGGHSSC
jgi:hypothetical protein